MLVLQLNAQFDGWPAMRFSPWSGAHVLTLQFPSVPYISKVVKMPPVGEMIDAVPATGESLLAPSVALTEVLHTTSPPATASEEHCRVLASRETGECSE